MKKFIFILIAIILCALFFSCSNNPALQVDVSKNVTKKKETKGIVIFRAFNYVLWEIEYDGEKYIVNSEGGIVKK